MNSSYKIKNKKKNHLKKLRQYSNKKDQQISSMGKKGKHDNFKNLEKSDVAKE